MEGTKGAIQFIDNTRTLLFTPISQCNPDFIAQIMTGEKKVRN